MADASSFRTRFEQLRREIDIAGRVLYAQQYVDVFVKSPWLVRMALQAKAPKESHREDGQICDAPDDVRRFQQLASSAALELLGYRGPDGWGVWLSEIEAKLPNDVKVERRGDLSPATKKTTIADCVLSSIRLCEELASVTRNSAPSETPAQALERLRQDCGWTIADLVLKAGVSDRAVRAHLKGATNISPDIRHKYCAAFELELGRPILPAIFAPQRANHH